jgi:HlyD family secretion protein
MKSVARKRVFVWGGIALVLLVLLAVAVAPRPVPVDLVTVDRGALRVTLDHEGKTRVHDRFMVSAPVAGQVLRIELEPGDPVVAGKTVMATFEPAVPPLLDVRSRAEAEARVRAARATLDRVQAELQKTQAERAFAQEQLERTRRLAADGIASRETLDAAELEARGRTEAQKAAESAARTAEHELEAARAALVDGGEAAGGSAGSRRATITLRAPIDGVVLRRLRESKAVVPAGEPLLELADPADLEIVADYLSTDAVRIHPGMAAQIEQWGGGTLRGHVRRVEPYGFLKVSALGVEEQRVNVIIDFDDPRGAWTSLGDGYRVEVRAIIWERTGVVKVPTGALFRQGESWAVFAVASGRARLRSIEVGQRNGLEAEVLKGLSPGERVVAHPSDAVRDGVRVAERS